MTNKELAEKLRCISTLRTDDPGCESCPFGIKEPLPEEMQGDFPEDFLHQCDCDRVGLYGADALENSESHVMALQQEIEKLRGQIILRNDELLKLREQVPRWIPVTERLPDVGATVLVCDYDGHIETGERNGCGWIGGWLDECATYWTPLPEPPKEEE